MLLYMHSDISDLGVSQRSLIFDLKLIGVHANTGFYFSQAHFVLSGNMDCNLFITTHRIIALISERGEHQETPRRIHFTLNTAIKTVSLLAWKRQCSFNHYKEIYVVLSV